MLAQTAIRTRSDGRGRPSAWVVAVIELDGRVAVFHVEDGKFLAIDDRCTHQEAYLSDGFVDGFTVECPLHASCFDLRTGAPIGPPAVVAVRTWPVVVRDEEVFIIAEDAG